MFSLRGQSWAATDLGMLVGAKNVMATVFILLLLIYICVLNIIGGRNIPV